MSMKALFASALFLFLLLAGCIKLQKESDCHAMQDDTSRSRCFYDAAIGYAITDREADAVRACKSITDTGWLLGSSEMDNCLMEVAEIRKNPDICNHIEVTQSGEFSSAITRDLCRSTATQRGQPACTTIFVLSTLFAIAAFAWKKS